MLYMTAIFTALLTATVSAAMVMGTLAQRRTADALDRLHEAEWIVRAGLNWALRRVYTDPNWRTSLPVDSEGRWTPAPVTVGDGSFEVWGTDPDGDLSDDPLDSVNLVIEATLGGVRVKRHVSLVPYNRKLVTYGAFSWKGAVDVKGGPSIESLVRANGDLHSDGSLVVNTASGGGFETVVGSRVDPPLTPYTAFVADSLPEPNIDVGWYLARGTALSVSGGPLQLSNVSLSTTQCLYNGQSVSPNPLGIYTLDAQGKDVILEDAYLAATLVIVKAGNVTVTGGFRTVWTGAGNACLVVDCEPRKQLVISPTESYLVEPVEQIDYNGDGDMLDLIRTRMDGIVLCNKHTTIEDNVPFVSNGLIVSRKVSIDGPITVREDFAIEATPVRGFLGPGMRVLPGTWQVEP